MLNYTRWCYLAALWVLTLTGSAAAQPKILEQSEATQKVEMEVGQTRLVRLSDKIIRVSIADPKVADVRVVTPRQVLLTARSVGYTHLILWGDQDTPLVMAVICRRNLDDLRTQLGELFPGENIKVSSSGELVVLSGKVKDLRVPARLAQVAKLHSEQLANLVEVSGEQQVQLEVRFAEVSRTGMRKMGMNFFWRDAPRGYVGGMTPPNSPGSLLQLPGTGTASGPPPVFAAPIGDAFSLLFSSGLSQFPFSAVLNILSQEGLAKILAEPTLVALSGHEAKFHAGGELPILVAQQLGTVSVDWKKFGIRLNFVPTVLGERTISLKVFAEVSEPDPTIGVSIGGFRVPGFKTRNSDTTVRLKDGQSFAIAGLLSDSVRSTVEKIPLLGEIPLLGALFRSKSFQREESELLVVIKAHLTQPIASKKAPVMPGEDTLDDPSAASFFLLGGIEGKKKKKRKQKRRKHNRRSAGGPIGPVGFAR